MFEILNSETFFKLQKSLFVIPFTQSEAWYNMVQTKKLKVKFFANSLENPSIMVWGVESKMPLLNKVILRINGEALAENNVDEKIVKEFYKNIKSLFKAIEVDSNTEYKVDYEIGIRRAGFKRPIAFFSCPLTLENNLNGNQSRSRSWKRNVKIAEKANLIFSEISHAADSHISEFVNLFSEMAKTKSMTHVVNFNEIQALLSHESTKLYAISTPNKETLAYRIIQINNDYAYDIFASNSNTSRAYRGSTYLLIEKIFESLKKQGVKYFDFGRIPPSNHNTDKIYEYKIGARGNKIQYNGEWVYYESFIVESLVFLYKYFKLRKQRY